MRCRLDIHRLVVGEVTVDINAHLECTEDVDQLVSALHHVRCIIECLWPADLTEPSSSSPDSHRD